MIGTPEEQVAKGEADDDGEEDAGVERHDGEHKEVTEGGVDPEEEGSGEPGRAPAAARGGGGEQLMVEERGMTIIYDGRGGRRRGRSLVVEGGENQFEAEASVFQVLIEDGEEEAGAEGEGVLRPCLRLPRIQQQRYLPSPIKGHVHHLFFPSLISS